jgi:hypothetical protein
VSFRFLDQAGNWLPGWIKGEGRQLPEAVQLVVRPVDDTVRTVTAIVPIRKSQEIPSSVLLFGRE